MIPSVAQAPRTKAQPGPGPTPVALIRALDLSIGRRIHGLVPGEFRAQDRGGGTELAQIRPYQPGDDVRQMDWNTTARTTIPHVREHVPERALGTWLLIDCSASMSFGTADRRKADVAEGVALAISHVATRRGNRLGVLTFGGDRQVRVHQQGGRAGLWTALITARRGSADPAPVSDSDYAPHRSVGPSPSLRLLGSSAVRGGLVVVVSDFRGPRDWLLPLAASAVRHHVLAVEIRDPREDDLPDVGELTLVDAETGREVRVDTSSRKLRNTFRAGAVNERASLAADLRRMRIDHVVLTTSGSWLRSLAGQLRTLGLVT